MSFKPALVLFTLLLAACNPSTGPGITADDNTGDRLRIVSLAPHLTELVYTAGAGDRLVGVVAYSDFPAAARELPVVGDAFRIDPERLAVLQPNLILAWKSGNPEAVISQLQRRGFNVEVLQTDTLDDVAGALREIGRLAGTSEIADVQADDYLGRLHVLRAQYQTASPAKVFYQISAQPLYTIGYSHPISEMIALCGGFNIFSDLDDVAPAVSVEDVILRAPDVIIAGRVPGMDGLEQWRRWQQMPAVAGGHLYHVDASLVTRASTRMLDGIAQICERMDRAKPL